MSDVPPPPPEQRPQPGWGQAPPPPGWEHPPPQAPFPHQYVMPQSTSGMAIASLVLGIIGLCMPGGGVLALVFGFIARNQIPRTGQAGDGMAIAGIILGFIGVAMLLFLVTAALTSAQT